MKRLIKVAAQIGSRISGEARFPASKRGRKFGKLLKIGDVAEILSVSMDTLRRWDASGKLSSIKTPGGTRYYSIEVLRKINPEIAAIIKKAKGEGKFDFGKFSSQEKEEYLGHPIVEELPAGRVNLFPQALSHEALVKNFGESEAEQEVKGWRGNIRPGKKLFLTLGLGAVVLGLLFWPWSGVKFLGEQLGVLPKSASQQQGQTVASVPGSSSIRGVLAENVSKNFLEINADTVLNGKLSIEGAADGFSISGGKKERNLTVFGSDVGLNQNLTSTSSPTFSSLSLSSSSNQLRLGGAGAAGTITWTPTAARTGTIPDATGTFLFDSAAQSITNKTISGSNNTFSNIPNSALSNSSIKINTSGSLSGGGSVSLGSSISLSGSAGVSATTSAGYIPRMMSTGDLGNSLFYDNGTNVGLGTTGPSYKLDVSGDINVSSGSVYRVGGTSGATVASAACVTSTGGIVTGSGSCPGGGSQWQLNSGVISATDTTQSVAIGGTATSSAKIFFNGVSGALVSSSSAQFAVASSTLAGLQIDASGFISNPGINGLNNEPGTVSINDIAAIVASSSSYPTLTVRGLSTQPAASISGSSALASFVVDNTTGDLFTASSSGLNRFVITQNGNVGIGTTVPSSKLHIVPSGIGDGVRVEAAGTNSPWVGFFSGSTEDAGLGYALVGGHFANNSSANDLVLYNLGTSRKLMLATGTSPTGRLIVDSSGNVGIGTTSPVGLLHVQGACVTGDTLIRVRRRKKKKNGEWEDEWLDLPITEVKEGDEVATLDEKTGKFVTSTVRQVMNMGVKKTFELITQSGKSIRTTAKHPYLVNLDENESQNTNSFYYQVFDEVQAAARQMYKEVFEGESISIPALGNEKITFSHEGWNHLMQEKRSRFDLMTRFFALPKVFMVLALAKKVKKEQGKINKNITFWTLEGIVDRVWVKVVLRSVNNGPKYFYSIVWKGEDYRPEVKAAIKKGAVSRLYPRRQASGKSLAFSTDFFKELSLARILTGRRRGLVTPQLFNKLNIPEDNESVKWVKVSDLKAGQKIATADGWETIIAIRQATEEMVYDLEIENTHNFVANGIVAHNTTGKALAAFNTTGDQAVFSASVSGTTKFVINNSGEIGIGTGANNNSLLGTLDVRDLSGGTLPVASFSGATGKASLIVDNSGTGDLFTASSSGLSRFVITQNGNVGIGTTGPSNGKLDIEGITSGTVALHAEIDASHRAFEVVDAGGGIVNLRSAGSGAWMKVESAGALTLASTGSNGISITPGTSGNVNISSGNLTLSSGLLTQTGSGNNSFVGNVGIGTTAPTALLQVKGSSTTQVASVSASTGMAGLLVDNTIGDLITASSSGLSRFVITQNGNVGIGSSIPSQKLDVLGAVRLGANGGANDILNTTAAGGAPSGSLFWGSRTVCDTSGSCNGGSAPVGGSGTTNYLARWTSSSVIGTGLLYDNGNGVAINTTVPLAVFDVNNVATMTAIASISGKAARAALIVDNSGTGDLFTASSSGLNRFVVTQNGNVGIGSSAPGSQLTLANSLNGGTAQLVNDTFSGISATTSLLDLKYTEIGNTSANWLRVFSNNSSTPDIVLAQRAGGAPGIGIGTTGPGYNIDVVQSNAGSTAVIGVRGTQTSGNASFYAQSDLGINQGAEFGIGGSGQTSGVFNSRGFVYAHTSLNGLSFLAQNTAGDFRFFTGGLTASDEKLRINSSGFLSNPNTVVGLNKIPGSVSVNGLFTIAATSAAYPAASVSANTGQAAVVIDQQGTGDLFTASSSGLNRFLISQTGQVQIGTQSAATRPFKFYVSDAQQSTASAMIENALANGITGDCTGAGGFQCHTGLVVKMGVPGGATVPTATDRFISFLMGNGVSLGSIQGTGNVSAPSIAYQTNGPDLGEYFAVESSVLNQKSWKSDPASASAAIFPEGTLVCQGTDGVRPCTASDSGRIVGLASARSGFVAGTKSEGNVLVGLIGQVPARIASDSGSINTGDLLAISQTHPGMATKATTRGYVVGSAITAWDPGKGFDSLTALVRPEYFEGDQYLASSDKLSIDQLQQQVASLSAQYGGGWSAAVAGNVDIASFSAQLATISGQLTVLGNTQLANTTIGGELDVGLVHIDDLKADISAMNGLLSFQNGGVTVDSTGNLKVTGTVSAKKVEAEEIKVLGSRTTGSARLPAGQTSVVVSGTASAATSRILVTPTTLTDRALVVTSKGSGQFTVAVKSPDSQDISFDWLVVQN